MVNKSAAVQTINGKAYEYACVLSIVELVSNMRPVRVVENSSFNVARNAWGSLDDSVKDTMLKSSKAGIRSLIQLEPKMVESDENSLELTLQADHRGVEGDVRDIVISRPNINWEIGISVKHNHNAVKHSRLSPTIDFGKEWLGINCSNQYFDKINLIFSYLKVLQEQGVRWSELNNKDEAVYVPLLNAFSHEMLKINKENSAVVPERLMKYLLGRKDFYKLISDDKNKSTKLQCFNIHGTLNKHTSTMQPALKVKKLSMPTTIHRFDYKNSKGKLSLTTIELVMDSGWQVSFRIHNGDGDVIPSLKFDIKLTGLSDTLSSNNLSW